MLKKLMKALGLGSFTRARAHTVSAPRAGGIVRASYDASKRSTVDARYWSNVDYLSPDASAAYEVRRELRSRARYELQENNSIGKGMVLTIANDVVGSGPRLQMMTGSPEFNQWVESEFGRWCQQVSLAAKLRTAVLSKKVDGEIFIWKVTNPGVKHQVLLDLRLLEGDQVTTPTFDLLTMENAVDGIQFDRWGNPTQYHVLRYHPGSNLVNAFYNKMEYDTVPAENIIHWFREDRPGQRRGMPEFASALPLFGMLRRYTLAVIAAAETAADFAAVMYSDSPAVDPDDVEAMDAIELESRAMLTLPKGWKLGQIKSEQPVDTYEMFKKQIIQEIARCSNVPYNVAAGDSSAYNYSSGRLDHQTYFKSIAIERNHIERVVLDDLFEAWIDEALLVPNYAPPLPSVSDLLHEWHWDGFEHVDPQKEAQAAISLVQAGLLTHAEYQASRGRDWESVMEQRAREKQKMEELGIEDESEESEDGQQVEETSEAE